MRFSYDLKHNIAYIRFCEKEGQVETIKISDELNIDLAPDGTVYGIELMNANKQLENADGGMLRLINEETGKQVEIPIKV